MLNSFFKNNVNRNTTYTPYFVNRPVPENAVRTNNQHKYRKYKLFILFIIKASHRQMRESLQRIVSSQRREVLCITKMVNNA